jgi:seryl-tRNA synthetase
MAALPKTLGTSIDRLYSMRQQRLEAQKKVDELKASESELQQHIIALMGKQRTEKASGKLATASRSLTDTAEVEDWSAFNDFIIENEALELLQWRPNLGALKERWAEKETVPGVSRGSVVKLSLRKSSR